MSQKPAPQRTLPRKENKPETQPSPEVEQVVEEAVLPETFLDKIQPHLATIALVILAVTLCFVAIQFWRSANFTNQAIQWVDLNQAKAINAATGDVKDLTRVADDYSTSSAGLIAALYAGDSQLRSGINQLAQDRNAGLELVKKAKNNYQSVVDASDEIKTQWLRERSRFSLAYAYETLGEFSSAKILYKELIDDSPNSPLIERAKRGLGRTSNDQYVELYETFRNYESTIGDAPGPVISDPNRPAIDDLGNVDLPPGQLPPTQSPLDKVDAPEGDKMEEPSGENKGPEGDKPADAPKEGENAEAVEEKTEPEMPAETPSKGETPEAETPAEKPATETPAEKPATETPAEKPATETPAEKPADPAPETPAETPESGGSGEGGGEGN